VIARRTKPGPCFLLALAIGLAAAAARPRSLPARKRHPPARASRRRRAGAAGASPGSRRTRSTRRSASSARRSSCSSTSTPPRRFCKDLRLDDAVREPDRALDLEPGPRARRTARARRCALKGESIAQQDAGRGHDRAPALRVQQMKAEVAGRAAQGELSIARPTTPGDRGARDREQPRQYAPFSIDWQGLDVEARRCSRARRPRAPPPRGRRGQKPRAYEAIQAEEQSRARPQGRARRRQPRPRDRRVPAATTRTPRRSRSRRSTRTRATRRRSRSATPRSAPAARRSATTTSRKNEQFRAGRRR
jgi:hypothetical protein